MSELMFRMYCFVHHTAKCFLGRTTLTVGNILKTHSLKIGAKQEVARQLWGEFIQRSIISSSEFKGNLYAGYIAESKKWCLPSWIWTNAATVREYCVVGKLEKAKALAAKLASRQLECGGWVVRNDYDKQGAIPMLAPNDSAYIANNAFLTLYKETQEKQYLNIACRCADWIIDTARLDGIVYVGYNMRDKKWDKNCVIVDVGFTGGLFSRLVEFTQDEKYLIFLKKFIARYIELFYLPQKHGFSTSIDKDNRPQGGMFGRGQAWALEGLIPAYNVLKDDRIKLVIDDTIENLLHVQYSDGAWAYNLTKPLMGNDCKSVSVIAKNMMHWYKVTRDERIIRSAEKALEWCCKHTATVGDAKGGIFSFCMEGAIVQNLYTSCAFVYASAYAIELHEMLK